MKRPLTARHTLRILPLAFVLFSFIVLPSSPCSAEEEQVGVCDCDPPTAHSNGMRRSTEVFLGTVIEKTKVSVPEIGKYYKELRIKFRVRRYWKGSGKRTIVIRTPVEGDHCGLKFYNNNEYLIYASGTPVPLTDQCTRSKHITRFQAGMDLRQLGEGMIPEGAEGETPRR